MRDIHQGTPQEKAEVAANHNYAGLAIRRFLCLAGVIPTSQPCTNTAAAARSGGIPNLPDTVTREAYSHEVRSAGFWPGGMGLEYPFFYSYAYPAPEGFADAKVSPPGAFYSREFSEFILPPRRDANHV
jgi:hypothetical protein